MDSDLIFFGISGLIILISYFVFFGNDKKKPA